MTTSNLFIGNDFTLHRYDILDSTNDKARHLAEAGAKEGAVVWSEHQGAGRGRGGRSWISEPGNLFASLLLRPGIVSPRSGELSLVAGVALAQSLEDLLKKQGVEAKVSCKWPNDVMINDSKIAGVLVESSLRNGRLDWSVVGIGLNIASSPQALKNQATCLKAQGVDISPFQALELIIPILWIWYRCWCGHTSSEGEEFGDNKGFEPVRQAWQSRAYVPESELLTVETADGHVRGTYSGLDDEGALLLTDADGTSHRIVVGDVLFDTGG